VRDDSGSDLGSGIRGRAEGWITDVQERGSHYQYGSSLCL
jgi:hypothetical protein